MCEVYLRYSNRRSFDSDHASGLGVLDAIKLKPLKLRYATLNTLLAKQMPKIEGPKKFTGTKWASHWGREAAEAVSSHEVSWPRGVPLTRLYRWLSGGVIRRPAKNRAQGLIESAQQLRSFGTRRTSICLDVSPRHVRHL